MITAKENRDRNNHPRDYNFMETEIKYGLLQVDAMKLNHCLPKKYFPYLSHVDYFFYV